LSIGTSALAGAVKQPPREYRLGRVQVDRRVQRHAEPGREFRGGDGLDEVPRETVQDVPAVVGRLGDGRGQHVEHDLVGNEITAGLMGGDLAAERALGLGLRPQQVTGGDVPAPDQAASRSPCVPLPAPGGASSSSLTPWPEAEANLTPSGPPG